MEKRIQNDNSIFVGIGIVVDEKSLWILSEDTDTLMHFDLLTRELLDYHAISRKKLVPCAHLELQKNGNVIFVIPYRGRNLVSFDTGSGEMQYIEIPYKTDEVNKDGKFCIAIIWKFYLILVGYNIKGIFYYDTTSGSFTRDMEYLGKLEKLGCDLSKPLFSDNYYQYEEKVYMPVYSQNIILEIDLETHASRVYELQHKKKIKLCTIDGYIQNGKEKFLLTTTDDEMIIWSPDSGIEKIEELKILTVYEKIYKRAFHIREKNYYIPAYERKVFVETDGAIKELEFEYESRGGFDGNSGHTQYEAVLKKDKDIYFQARSNGQLFRIDTETDKVYRIDFDVLSDKQEEVMYRVCSGREISVLNETACLRLDRFIKIII